MYREKNLEKNLVIDHCYRCLCLVVGPPYIKKNIFKISPYKVDQLMTSSRCCDNILRDILIGKLD